MALQKEVVGQAIDLFRFWQKKPQSQVHCLQQGHNTCVYVVTWATRGLALDTKPSTEGARQWLMAENNCSKGFTKGSGGTNDRSIMILMRKTPNEKCTEDNKRTTRVYTSFFTPQWEFDLTAKQAQYTIPIINSFIHSQLLSGFLLNCTS